MSEKLEKWRLILGRSSDPQAEYELGELQQGMDKVLEALYDSDRKGGLGSSSPNINRWLGDIRKFFPTSVVQVMQKDALQRLRMERMLLEPELLEAVEPDVHLVATLLTLSKVMPSKTQATAREVVAKVVKALEARLRQPFQAALKGALNRASRNLRPRWTDVDWNKTIKANLKTYQPSLGAIIPERLIGYGRKNRQLRDIILLVDQSGSMASSVVYAGILGCVMASVSAIHTRVVAFDTSVVELTEHLSDPVSLLFATQLGGGTDIAKALAYVQPTIRRPADTILVLISDLFEGGRPEKMLKKVAEIKASGVRIISLLALNDEGAPAYDHAIAEAMTSLGIVAFACTPDSFAALMAAAINGEEYLPSGV